MKKGQMTLFVIIGIGIVILMIALFIYKDTIIQQLGKIELIQGLTMSKEARQVQEDMEECMIQESHYSLKKLGLQGGYIELGRLPYMTMPEIGGFYEYKGTVYLYDQGRKNIPTIELMQNHLEDDITKRALNCKKEYSNMKVSYGTAKPEITIQQDKVIFNIQWPAQIQKEDSTSKIKNVNYELQIQLGKIISITKEIIENQDEEICLSCLTELGYENDMEISIEKKEEDILYLITDHNSQVKEEEFEFLMALKF